MASEEFNPNAGGPGYSYLRLADHLAAQIESGKLPPDARLPGERELASTYGVALGTIRRATAVLRDRGLVVTLAAKGTFVASDPPTRAGGNDQAAE